MAEVLLCCEMLRDEVELAMERTGAQVPVVWVDAGLHEHPERLREELHNRIAQLETQYDTVLMGFCLCGNATVGVGGSRAKLVAPRFDDCIRMLMCRQPGTVPDVDCRCMYFTQGWTRSEEAYIGCQYQHACEKYGPVKGKRVYRSMLKNYTTLMLVDTGAYDMASCGDYVRQTAQALELEYGEVRGTIRILEKLLRHEWDEEFYCLEPGEVFSQMEFLPHPEP